VSISSKALPTHSLHKIIDTLVLFEGFRELSNNSGNFDSVQQDSFLSLENNIFGPFDKSCKISSWLNIIANSKISWFLLKQGINLLLNFLD
jgi:hypothetical protein